MYNIVQLFYHDCEILTGGGGGGRRQVQGEKETTRIEKFLYFKKSILSHQSSEYDIDKDTAYDNYNLNIQLFNWKNIIGSFG